VPAESAIMVGGEAGLYRNTGGEFANPGWNEVLLARDVTPGGGFDFQEASDRATALKLYAKTQLDKPIQVVMRADTGSAEYRAWVAAANSRKATLDLLILNKKRTVVGALGWRGLWLVSLTTEAQEIGGVIYSTFELRPTRGTDGNHVYVASVGEGGVITYTAVSWTA
jgi:hypothetical protein